MSSHRIRGTFACHLEKIKQRLAAGPVLFSELLSGEMVQRVLAQHDIQYRETVYTPYVTLSAFLWQALSEDGSCQAAVHQVMAHCCSRGQRPCSPATSTYCEARARLPEVVFEDLLRHTAQTDAGPLPSEWLCWGRRVKVVDGTTASMPDTRANRAEFPLADSKRAGLSDPMLRMVVVFSLATGAVLEHAVRPYLGKGTSELAMFRQLLSSFQRGEIVLGDRGFCSFGHAALLVQRGVDLVVKLNASRWPNLKLVRRLNAREGLYRWEKPARRPDSFTAEEFAALPDALTVRLIKVHVKQRGFRCRKFFVLTTLAEGDAAEIANLFRRRWQCELFLRDLKATLGMRRLRCRTPDMVRRELLTYLLAYNLIRLQMAQAAEALDLAPHALSFKAAAQAVEAFRHCRGTMTLESQAALLAAIGQCRIGKQPDRYEPRLIKRRSRYNYLMQPRRQARKQLLKKTCKLSE